MSKLKYLKKFLWKWLGRCYYCGHRECDHLTDRVRECKQHKCDCFGFDFGPQSWNER